MGPPPPFHVEQWMDKYETSAKYQLAETCCASISIDELCSISERKGVSAADILKTSQVQGYGEIRGTTELRTNLSKLYSSKVATSLPIDNILITPGAIAANHLVFFGLVGPGDHVVCHYPTYQQLYEVPRSCGAEVDLWRSNVDDQWMPDFAELEALIKLNTKMIVLNNPQNPTGAILPRSLLQRVVQLAESKGIIVMSDEVYRPLFHGISPMDAEFPPSILSLGHKNVIATGSLSKAYSLAGIRIGWVASRSLDLIEAIAAARDYTTISVSQLDQAVASFAISSDTVHALLARNIHLAKTNVELLEKFIHKHDEYCSWVRPKAGTTAFVKFSRDGKPVDAAAFCKALQDKTGVMMLPGNIGFGCEFKGYVRIGYVNSTEIIKNGLEELCQFMKRDFDEIPLAE